MRARTRVHTHTRPTGTHTLRYSECEKPEYLPSRTAPLSSPLISGTSFSPCKKAKLTVGSLCVYACVIYQPHATAPPKRTKTTLCAILRSGRSSPSRCAQHQAIAFRFNPKRRLHLIQKSHYMKTLFFTLTFNSISTVLVLLGGGGGSAFRVSCRRFHITKDTCERKYILICH